MKRKWLALLLSCTMVVNTGVLPVAATTLDNESAVVQQMNEETSDTQDRKSTRLNSSHMSESRMPSSA